MGNIVQYNAPPGATPQPNDIAASTAREAGQVENRFAREGGEAVGGAISRVGGQIGDQIDAHVASQAIGHGAATYSQLYSDLTNQWNQIAAKADPNDTSVAQGFQEKVLGPSIDKFTSAFDGQPQRAQAWAQAQADSMRQHFFEKTTADMGTRAGAAIEQNLSDMEKNFSHTAADDPTTLGHISDTVNSSIDALVQSSPYVSADDAVRIKTQVAPRIMRSVASAAFYGAAQNNPDGAIASLKKGDYDQYLSEDEKNKMENFAKVQKRAQAEDAERDYVLKHRAQTDASEATKNSYISDILGGKGADMKKVAADLTLTPEAKENISAFNSEHVRQLKENADSDSHPEVVRSLLNNMFQANPNNLSADPIRQAFIKGQLNPQEETYLESRYNGMDKPMERNFQNQISRVDSTMKSSIAGQTLLMSNPGAYSTAVTRLETDAHEVLDSYRAQGKDVTPLLDPSSKDYLFAPGKVSSYFVQSTAANPTAGSAAKAPGSAAPTGPSNDVKAKALEILKANPSTLNDYRKHFGEPPADWNGAHG